jgi:regulator of sirC expression with transglutaminase-like and TPR domain
MAGVGREPENPAERDAWRAAASAAARERFGTICRLPDAEIDLAEAALVIANEEYPSLDVDAYLRQLDQLGRRVRDRIAGARQGRDTADPDDLALEALHAVLFDEEGYAGAGLDGQEDYYLPRNSFLNEVMERKRGLPILLAVLYCAVAQRAGLDAVGINAPGHFLAEFRGQHARVLVDPYHRGARVDHQRLSADVLLPASHKATLARMLTNLKLVYVQRHQFMKALAAAERLLMVQPTPAEVRDRGIILRALGEQLLRDARERFQREKDGDADTVNRALIAVQTAMQHAQYLFGSAWFDLSLFARLGEGDAGSAGKGAGAKAPIAESARQLWHLLGRNN